MRIAIVGPGAMGLFLTGLLHRAGLKVFLVDYLQERANMLNRDGIHWQGLDDEVTIHIPVTVGLDQPSDIDLVILCVKAYQTEAAVLDLASANYKGPLLTLQNGIGNVETIKRHLPEMKIIAGITSEGATLLSLGHVRHAGKGETVFGAVKYGCPEEKFLKELSRLLDIAGLKTKLSTEIENLIWGKLIINVGINALTAILRVHNGQLLEIAPIRQLMADLVNEACNVVEAKGITLPYPNPIDRVEEVCRMTSANISSMHQDILRGSRTEIDYINGAVAREGESRDIPCTLNKTITLLVQGLEKLNQRQT